MSRIFDINLDDTAIEIEAVLRVDGVPWNFDGWTGRFRLYDTDGVTLLIDSPCTIANQTVSRGRVSYGFSDSDLSLLTRGVTYTAKFFMTRTADSKTATFPRGGRARQKVFFVITS